MAVHGSIFIVEVVGAPPLAFEAECEAQAAAFARAPWFTEALRNYLRSKCPGIPHLDLAPRIRPARKDEASAYRGFASEFADVSDGVFLAPLS